MSIITAAEALGHKKGRSVAKLIAEMTTSYQNGIKVSSKLSPRLLPTIPTRNKLPEEWMRETVSSDKSSHEYPDINTQYPNNITPANTSCTFGPSDPNSRAWTAFKTSSRNRSVDRLEEPHDGDKLVEKNNEEAGKVSDQSEEHRASNAGDQMSFGNSSPPGEEANI
ncbi:hypothetical protein DID88_001234 [Monilinia fructigena]|uniref:Uncharacterized protein n=1 Tax=Monilinia fructigena TaxID=38457 RepID=A0A395IZ92_9HELO|nr:hypothetical protein DID88_001234 [Monilinia fructigena]